MADDGIALDGHGFLARKHDGVVKGTRTTPTGGRVRFESTPAAANCAPTPAFAMAASQQLRHICTLR
jgi:hypothetical protein